MELFLKRITIDDNNHLNFDNLSSKLNTVKITV